MVLSTLKWRFPLILCIVALCLWIANPPFDPDGDGPEAGKLKLGLDLQGGMHLVLRVKTEILDKDQREDATERALEVIRNRVDQFGVAEPSIQRQGRNQIVLQLPGISDRKRALDLIGKTALLEFKLVAEDQSVMRKPDAKIPKGYTIYQQRGESPTILLESERLLEGKYITDAKRDYGGEWNDNVVMVYFDGEGAKFFGDITSKNVGRQLAIILDDVVVSAPVIEDAIYSGEAMIKGSFTVEEAQDLSRILRAGALPAPIVVEEERTVGPTLGHDSIEQGIRATFWAVIAVVVFMAVYYLAAGLIADLVLCLNILIIAACLSYFKATLTLPGIAGVILTIGMAVDLNVIILERIREEMRAGKKAMTAIASGYRKAFSAILDSNLTTLITALILIRFGTGPIRGFALTLAIGIVASFFTGLFVTRVIYDYFWGVRGFSALPMLSFMKSTPKIPFMKHRKIFLGVSVLAMLVSAGLIFTNLDKSLGIDFTGGVLQEYRFEEAVETEDVRDALEEIGMETAIIQKFGSENDIVIRSGEDADEDSIREIFKTRFASNPNELIRVEAVGPVVGRDLRKKSLMAVFFSLLSIMIYLAYRFEFRYSVAAIAALFHDTVICLGAIVLTGRELSIPVLAAILTIVGYSVNDTIVTFDRVREDYRRSRKEPFKDTVNNAVNETLSRTLLTSFTTLVVVTALYFFGGPVINDFAFTMIVGVLAGTYSSIFVACPVIIGWSWTKRKRGA